jgi:hypothetical protein
VEYWSLSNQTADNKEFILFKILDDKYFLVRSIILAAIAERRFGYFY